MKKPKPKFDEDRARNDFLKLIDSQPTKVQVRMCLMAMVQVLSRIRTDVGFSDAMKEMMEMVKLMEMIQDLDLPSKREH
jgi:hypothetical protein